MTVSTLNFADVLIALGRFPIVDGRQPRLGMDFVGVVTAVGPDVTDHQVGDRVGGVRPGFLANLTCDANLAVASACPPGLEAEIQAAAATPRAPPPGTAFTTWPGSSPATAY